MRTTASRAPTTGPITKVVLLVLLLAICLGVGQIGAWITGPGLEGWYPILAKPSWTPPDLAFPIVWTALYVMMAVAAWRLWLRAEPGTARLPLLLFFIQLGLNLLWSYLFFGLHRPGLALADIGVLLLALAATILAFGRIDAWAAWLLVPYLLWSGFAAALNFAIWQLNS